MLEAPEQIRTSDLTVFRHFTGEEYFILRIALTGKRHCRAGQNRIAVMTRLIIFFCRCIFCFRKLFSGSFEAIAGKLCDASLRLVVLEALFFRGLLRILNDRNKAYRACDDQEKKQPGNRAPDTDLSDFRCGL